MSKQDLRSPQSILLLKRYSKSIIHMRQQFRRKQFGLVFGSGIGVDLNFPNWKELLKRIATHGEVASVELLERMGNSTAVAQHLYQNYKKSKHKICLGQGMTPKMMEMEIRAGWRKIVHQCLYDGIPSDTKELLKNDKYLEALVPLITESPLTVTYNFDDTLQRVLYKHTKDKGNDKGKGYRTCWSGNVQLQGRSSGVIYHPNGFLPLQLRERPSDHLVFSEDSFADQLIDSMTGQYASLATHFSQTTCLLIGLSLDDPTLKHLLRHTANNFPGHFHYYIKHIRDDEKREPDYEEIEKAANFSVYNLNTLYLTSSEIKSLAILIAADEAEFAKVAQEAVQHTSFRFFVVGSVGAGKSTTVGNFRSMLSQDEWTEERAPNMEKAPDLLTKEEELDIDKWVANQVQLKNLMLIDSTQSGIHVIDRAPLDAFAFTEEKEWSAKATLLKNAVAPGLAKDRKLVSGHVIFLQGMPEVMAERAVSLHKKTTTEKLEKQQKDLLYVYKKLKPDAGFTVINVNRKTVQEVVKDVAQVIFSDTYEEADMHQLLLDIERDGYDLH